jgi:hypothetical protein
MARFKVTTYKRLIADPEDHWTNVYTVESANAITALDNGETIAGLEADVMGETAEVFRISAINVLGGEGVQREVTLPGLQDVPNPEQLMPQWNVVKVTFASLAGRPEIKYLRLPLYMFMVEGQQLLNGTQTNVQLGYAGPLADLPFYVGPNGEAHTGATVSNNIQMRQTNWHRRTRPGFIRGWVPV